MEWVPLSNLFTLFDFISLLISNRLLTSNGNQMIADQCSMIFLYGWIVMARSFMVYLLFNYGYIAYASLLSMMLL